MKQGKVDFIVGVFILIAAVSLMFLALKVSGLSAASFGNNSYKVTASFSDIGGLKVRSPVKIAGVQIGQVSAITLNNDAYNAVVTMSIENSADKIPVDSSARISQSGLLGDNYISLSPGYKMQNLKNGSVIKTTYSATSITSLISTFVNGANKK